MLPAPPRQHALRLLFPLPSTLYRFARQRAPLRRTRQARLRSCLLGSCRPPSPCMPAFLFTCPYQPAYQPAYQPHHLAPPRAVPGLDDLLLDDSAGDGLFADPFGGLDSPWEPTLKAEPLGKAPKSQQPQPPHSLQLPLQPPQPQPPQPPPQPPQPNPFHQQAQAAPASARHSCAASPQPILVVRQQQAQGTSLLVHARSADNRQSQLGTAALTADVRLPAAPAAPAGSRKRSAGAKPGSRTAVAAAAPPPPAQAQQPRREQQRQAVPLVCQQAQQAKQQQQRRQPQQLQRQATLPAQGAKRALPAPSEPEVFRLPGISLPLPAPEQSTRAQPPAERWVLLDASCRRPVKRGAGWMPCGLPAWF